MFNFDIKNEGNFTYFVYSLEKEDEIDTLSAGMIVNNEISGVIPLLFTQMDQDKFFKYNISSKVTLEQYFEGVVSRKRLLEVLSGICTAFITAEDYMIDTSQIILEADKIFIDISSNQVMFICLPILSYEEYTELSDFLKNLVFTTQFDSNENCDYIAKIIGFLNRTEEFSISEFKQLTDSLMDGSVRIPIQQTPAVKPPSYDSGYGNNYDSNLTTVLDSNSATANPFQESIQPEIIPKKPDWGFKPTPKQTPIPEPSIEEIPAKGKPVKEKKIKEKKQKVVKEKKVKEKRGFFGFGAKKKESLPPPGLNMPSPPGMNRPTASRSQSFSVPGQQSGIAKPEIPAPKAPHQWQEPVYTQPEKPKRPEFVPQPTSFGETTVLGGSSIGETMVLSEAMVSGGSTDAYILRMKDSRRIAVNKGVFRIGSDGTYVDYCVADNPAISRRHASIYKKGNEYYIIDTNSKNHTYINDQMIPPDTETVLRNGSRIKLANEEFEFIHS